jgi:diguanylate cyclase (GGDEF)-like protein
MYHELRDLYHDQVTKLPNRNALIKQINSTSNMSLLALVDIDKFSILNDLYGEKNGDRILLEFSLKLKEYFSDDYTIYRVGADKFVVLCTCSNEMQCRNDFKQLCNQFAMEISLYGIELPETDIDLNITIGIALSDDKHAFEYAQRAVQKARSQYLQILEYDASQFNKKEDIEENIKWIKKIKNGFDNNNFQPYFQPIIDAHTQKVYKYEALIRYIEDDGTEIAPYIFLPIAKKAKLFPIVIKLMLNGVIEIIKEKNIRVAVNISFDDIVNQYTQEFIFNTLKQNQEAAKLLDFEILESEEIEDFDLVKTFILKIKEYGCNIGIDDFGAGYSNFNMIEALNVDFVKIDGSLIVDIDIKPKQALIVETISQFCKKLGVKTVAEFVSTEKIYHLCTDLGIDYMQGWYFGKAINKNCI